MDASVKARHALKRNMPDDIASGRFHLVFQPIVDATTRKIVGAEGLARWRDIDKIIAPAEFIPIAEESGSIANLGNRLSERDLQRPAALDASQSQGDRADFGEYFADAIPRPRASACA